MLSIFKKKEPETMTESTEKLSPVVQHIHAMAELRERIEEAEKLAAMKQRGYQDALARDDEQAALQFLADRQAADNAVTMLTDKLDVMESQEERVRKRQARDSVREKIPPVAALVEQENELFTRYMELAKPLEELHDKLRNVSSRVEAALRSLDAEFDRNGRPKHDAIVRKSSGVKMPSFLHVSKIPIMGMHGGFDANEWEREL